MENLALQGKVKIIYTILRLAKNNNHQYVLEDESAKELTKSIMEHIKTFDMTQHNDKYYNKNVNDSLDAMDKDILDN